MISKTYLGVLIAAILPLLRAIGIDLPDADTQATGETVLTAVGSLLALYGRYRAGGITVIGTRKPS